MAERGIRAYLSLRKATFPVKEILAFTLPLLTTDLVYVSLGTTDAVVLQHFWGAAKMADLRVVPPLANLNLLVFSSFTLLYLPTASRLHARGDLSGVADLYWRSATWVASFPSPCSRSPRHWPPL